MTITVSDVITQARIRLADGGGDRWNDARLLSLFTEGLETIALRTELFVRRGYVPVENERPYYDLSNRVLKLLRIAYKGPDRSNSVPLSFIPHVQLDNPNPTSEISTGGAYGSRYGAYGSLGIRFGSGWDGETGTEPCAIIVSNQQPGNFRLYPIPKFDVPTQTAVPLQGSGEEGGVDGVSDLVANPVDVVNSDIMPYGGVDVTLPARYLDINYVEQPTNATELTQTYDLNKQYRIPLENFIVAKALRDQSDTYDPERSIREWNFFLSSLEELEEQRSQNFRGPKITRIKYRPYD